MRYVPRDGYACPKCRDCGTYPVDKTWETCTCEAGNVRRVLDAAKECDPEDVIAILRARPIVKVRAEPDTRPPVVRDAYSILMRALATGPVRKQN